MQSRKYGAKTNVWFSSNLSLYDYATTNPKLLIGLDHLREENQWRKFVVLQMFRDRTRRTWVTKPPFQNKSVEFYSKYRFMIWHLKLWSNIVLTESAIKQPPSLCSLQTWQFTVFCVLVNSCQNKLFWTDSWYPDILTFWYRWSLLMKQKKTKPPQLKWRSCITYYRSCIKKQIVKSQFIVIWQLYSLFCWRRFKSHGMCTCTFLSIGR